MKKISRSSKPHTKIYRKNKQLEEERNFLYRKVSINKDKLAEYLYKIGYVERGENIIGFDSNLYSESESQGQDAKGPEKCLCLIEVHSKRFDITKIKNLGYIISSMVIRSRPQRTSQIY